MMHFTEADVVRHPLVQSIIRAYERNGSVKAAESEGGGPKTGSSGREEAASSSAPE
jgi:phosphate starvation-inducible PhoH-like protein